MVGADSRHAGGAAGSSSSLMIFKAMTVMGAAGKRSERRAAAKLFAMREALGGVFKAAKKRGLFVSGGFRFSAAVSFLISAMQHTKGFLLEHSLAGAGV